MEAVDRSVISSIGAKSPIANSRMAINFATQSGNRQTTFPTLHLFVTQRINPRIAAVDTQKISTLPAEYILQGRISRYHAD